MSNAYVDVYVAGPVVCIYFKAFASGSSWQNVAQIPTKYAPATTIILCTRTPDAAFIQADTDGTLKTYMASAGVYNRGVITYIIPL